MLSNKPQSALVPIEINSTPTWRLSIQLAGATYTKDFKRRNITLSLIHQMIAAALGTVPAQVTMLDKGLFQLDVIHIGSWGLSATKLQQVIHKHTGRTKKL